MINFFYQEDATWGCNPCRDRSLDQVGEMEHNYIETPISVKKKLLKKFLRISTQLDELSRLVKKYF